MICKPQSIIRCDYTPDDFKVFMDKLKGNEAIDISYLENLYNMRESIEIEKRKEKIEQKSEKQRQIKKERLKSMIASRISYSQKCTLFFERPLITILKVSKLNLCYG